MAVSSIYNMFGNQQTGNSILNMINQFNQFKQNFNGDAQQEVQRLLNSGQMTQQQFNKLSQTATQFQRLMNMR